MVCFDLTCCLVMVHCRCLRSLNNISTYYLVISQSGSKSAFQFFMQQVSGWTVRTSWLVMHSGHLHAGGNEVMNTHTKSISPHPLQLCALRNYCGIRKNIQKVRGTGGETGSQIWIKGWESNRSWGALLSVWPFTSILQRVLHKLRLPYSSGIPAVFNWHS